MELTREGILLACQEAERRFGTGSNAVPLRLGLYWAQHCRTYGLQMPTDEDVRAAAQIYCEVFPPEPPASAREIRYWLRIGLGRKARTESVSAGFPALPLVMKR